PFASTTHATVGLLILLGNEPVAAELADLGMVLGWPADLRHQSGESDLPQLPRSPLCNIRMPYIGFDRSPRDLPGPFSVLANRHIFSSSKCRPQGGLPGFQ